MVRQRQLSVNVGAMRVHSPCRPPLCLTLLLRSNWVASWAVPPLAAALPALPALRRLALASNNLPAEAAAPLAAALPVCPALTELDVANNALGREGALALAEASVGCSALRCLRLAGNLTGAASATVHAVVNPLDLVRILKSIDSDSDDDSSC